MKARHLTWPRFGAFAAGSLLAAAAVISPAQAQQKRPNIVMLMTDDTGWNDFGAYSGGGASLGHPTPNVDQIAKEGAVFTNWYGQASCTAGRASFLTGRLPIRSALSIVVAPGDENYLRKETPTIAEFFKKNGYTTYFSGKWHMGDKPVAYPIEHGFDEMKEFAAYYAGVYAYNDTSNFFHPWFPSYNPQFNQTYDSVVNLGEWEGVAGQPATRVGTISYDSLATFDIRQTDSAIAYIQQHANGSQPFFMDVNFIKMHNPTNAAPEFRGKSHLGDYSDSLMELDADIGRITATIRAAGTQYDRHLDRRQRCLARCLSRCRDHAVSWRERYPVRRRLARPRHHVVAEPHCGRRAVWRDDVAHRRLGDIGRNGRSDAAAARLGRQRRQADLFRQHRQ